MAEKNGNAIDKDVQWGDGKSDKVKERVVQARIPSVHVISDDDMEQHFGPDKDEMQPDEKGEAG